HNPVRLQSFPTRRSSDLHAQVERERHGGEDEQIEALVPRERAVAERKRDDDLVPMLQRASPGRRNEDEPPDEPVACECHRHPFGDRKSTRLNSSHEWISY